jgi:hypothetical protein
MHYELIALWASGQEFCIDMQSVREDSRLDERDSAAGCAGLCPRRHQSGAARCCRSWTSDSAAMNACSGG